MLGYIQIISRLSNSNALLFDCLKYMDACNKKIAKLNYRIIF